MTAKDYSELMEGRYQLVDPGVEGLPTHSKGKVDAKAYLVSDIKWDPVYLTQTEADYLVKFMKDMFHMNVRVVFDGTDHKNLLVKSEGYIG